MKYIEKSLKNEPNSLKKYRETTPNASYAGYGSPNDLKKAILIEQGCICAYCMRRINFKSNIHHKPQIEIEHIKPQEKYPELDLNYENLVGVCNGNLGGNEHCDKSKKSTELRKLVPTNRNCESLIAYKKSGLIVSVSNNQEVEFDINKVLNLNNQNLIDNRIQTIDLIIENLDKKYPKKTWTKKIIQSQIAIFKERNKNGEYWEFSNFIVWYFSDLEKRPKYK
jgi:uncharacterized protein (TIGR02646 family)